MGYVPEYKWDVFVSYAFNDDSATNPDDEWVGRFVRDLRIGIKNWVGNADKLEVFFAKDSLAGGVPLTALRDYARDSAIFIAVVSPSYIKRDWPLVELNAFSGGSDISGRLFAIECRPIGDYAHLPERLRDFPPTPFFIQDAGARAPRPLSPEQDVIPWKNRIEELTKDIGVLLQQIKEGKPRQNKPPGGGVKRTVLLAQTTEDMTDQCDEVRRYLTQAGHAVLPSQGCYPQGAQEFKAAFAADLARAELYIQLLGMTKARRDPALTEGYPRFQFDAAKAAALVRPKLKTFIWRPANINVDDVKHEDGGLLREPTVTAMTLESLKKEVEAAIERFSYASASDGNGQSAIENTMIFINAAPSDQEIAGAVSDECSQQGFTAIMPSSDKSAVNAFKQMKGRLATCAAYFLIFGKAEEEWAIDQGVIFSKVSAELSESDLPKVIAIIDGPPEVKNSAAGQTAAFERYQLPNVEDPVRRILAELRQ